MSNHLSVRFSAGVRLDINRDSDFLNQFVGTNTEDVAEVIEGDQKDPLKLLTPHKGDIFKNVHLRKLREEKKVEFDKKLPQEEEPQEAKVDESKAEENEDETVVTKAASKEEKPKAKIGQKQINQELRKKRRKRRRPKPEEVYTDKDRAASVNLGTRDIKQSLRIKRREDRTRILQLPDEAEPSTYLALGHSELIRRGPTSALVFYHKVVTL